LLNKAGSRGGQPDEARTEHLEFPDNRLLIDLCGGFDSHLSRIEATLGIHVMRRGNSLVLHGPREEVGIAAETLGRLYERLEEGRPVGENEVEAALRLATGPGAMRFHEVDFDRTAAGGGAGAGNGPVELRTRRKVIEPRTPAQKDYITKLLTHELVFGLGPAGTGKTYLAVAAAVALFNEGRVDRIILSRPAVEAGERLGFLPGDMKEKVDPYMQPLYDALHDFIPARQLGRLMEEKRIEIAPLAFMRGRTLADAFVVLDEAQNATAMQMKMFLTRLGRGARMAITGDPSQIDLPRGVASGLVAAERILKGVEGVAFSRFSGEDVVRHPLVARIIDAWERDAAARRSAAARHAEAVPAAAQDASTGSSETGEAGDG